MIKWLIYLFGLIQIGAFAIIFLQLRSLKKSVKTNHQHQVKQATLEYINAMSQRHNKSLDRFNEKHGTNEAIGLSSYSDGDLYTAGVYLKDIEQLCGGVEANLYDYEAIKKIMGSKLLNDYFRFENFINNDRTTRNRPLHYLRFELMVKRLKLDKT